MRSPGCAGAERLTRIKSDIRHVQVLCIYDVFMELHMRLNMQLNVGWIT